jgi:hypothetical protein
MEYRLIVIVSISDTKKCIRIIFDAVLLMSTFAKL